MANWTDYDIVGSYNNTRVSEFDAERSVNLFEYIDSIGKKPKVLFSTSGLTNSNLSFPFETLGFRSQFVFNDSMYCVIGSNIFKIDSSLTVTNIFNGLTTSTGYVGIDANTFQIIFVDTKFGYIYDTQTGVFAQITDTSFPTVPVDVCYLDGFFVVANGGTNTFQLSSFNQGLIWGTDHTSGTGNAFLATSGGSPNLVLGTGTTLNYQKGTPVIFSVGGGGVLPVGTPPIVAGTIYYVKTVVNATTFTISPTPNGTAITFSTTGTAPIFITNNGQLQLGSITTHPGTIVACRTLHRRLFLFSQNFIEVWENAGAGTNLPFRRNNTMLIEYGTPSRASIVVGFDFMFFLSQDKDGLGAVMQVIGTQGVPVSNRALDFQFAQYAQDNQINEEDPRGILIKENGLIFYRLNFTGTGDNASNHTFVYNVSMSNPAVEEEKRWHEEEVLNGDRHPAQTHAFFQGINYYGDYKQPIMYVVDTSNSTNNGESIKRMRIGKPVGPGEYKRTRVDRYQLDILQGALIKKQFNKIFTADPITDTLTIDSTSIFDTGDQITVYSTGALPIPLIVNTIYYVIVISDTEIKLATSFANAIAGTFIDITSTGVGINSLLTSQIQDISPIVYLSYSKDGGQTYGNRIIGNMGPVGQRSARTVWRKLGVVPRGKYFVPKIEFFTQTPFIILGAAWVFEILPE